MPELFKPKVTIAIPVYNGSNFLAEAIDSALAQTYGDVEVVVVNDGSTDNGMTASIALSYGARIIYIEQANGGVGAAMNTALAHMTGDVFTWLSHDDIHLPEKVTSQVDYYNAIGKIDAVLFSDAHLMDDSGVVFATTQRPQDELIKRPMLAILNGHINGCTLFIPTHIIRRFLPFNVRLRFTQDYDMWSKIISEYDFFYQQKPLIKYRVHSGQDSHKPAAVEEGDSFWIQMLDARSEMERVQTSGSSENFFSQMAAFLEQTPFKRAADHASRRRDRVSDEATVSIVLPFFNEVSLVMRAVESVRAQSFERWELILVDDGSTDDTSAVAGAAISDSRIQLVQQRNAGAGAARNLGLSMVEGTYVALLDADDLFLPQKLQRQLGVMQERGAVFSHTSYNVTFPQRHDHLGVVRSGEMSGQLYPSILAHCAIATSTVMFHRSILAQGFEFPTDMTLGVDALSWIWVAQRHKILGIEEPLSVIEWDANSVPFNVSKALRAATHISQKLRNDPHHCRQQELLHHNKWITRLMNIHPRSRYWIEGPLLDEDLIRTLFL